MAGIFRKILDIFFLLRIPLLAPVWTILILGWIVGNPDLSIGDLLYSGQSSPLWHALFGFSLLVASIYVVNQISDIESDRINRKLFLLPHGYVSVRTAWILAFFCAATGLFLASLLGPWMTVLFGAGLLLGVFYNLPPFSLKNRALSGVLANSLGHGLITFLVGWLAAKGDQNLTFSLFSTGLTSSLAPALANGAVFLATTIPDAEGDSRTGKKTFCVAYGPKATALTASLFCALALLSSFFMESHFWVMAVPSLISLGFFINSALTTRIESAYIAFKWPVFLLSVFVTLFVPTYGILILITFISSRLYYKWRFGIEYPSFKSK
ncbi:MAG: UbiA family prenyltransferase [Chitinispirillaceae bacterium]